MLVWVLVALTLVGLSLTVSAQQGTTVSGLVSASDQEVEEGYFALGQEVTVVAKPGSVLHSWLNSHKGERVTITLDQESSH
jgi:hypothetical protein